MSSLDRILPFLRQIEDLLVDPTVTEVMVNDGGKRVFVERDGTIEAVADRTLEPRNLTVAIKNIARACGDEISERQPILDARLEDGSRVAAMFPPCAVAGPTLTVRKFTYRYSLDDLVTVGTLTTDIAAMLRRAVDAQQNILISASHTHSGPGGYANFPTLNTAAPSMQTVTDPSSFFSFFNPQPAAADPGPPADTGKRGRRYVIRGGYVMSMDPGVPELAPSESTPEAVTATPAAASRRMTSRRPIRP